MKTRMSLFAALASLLAGNAHAITLQIDWTGVATSTTDLVGDVFDNGTGADTGVGSIVSGQILWTDPYWNVGTHNGAALYDWDVDGNASYGRAQADPFISVFTVGNETYNSEMNLGSYYSILERDAESGASSDSYSMWIRNSGYYQTGPVVAGLSDHIDKRTFLTLQLESLLGGSLINGLDPAQTIDWVASPGDPTSAVGSVYVRSSLWEDATDTRYTGTETAMLQQASASFVLTSFRAVAVPEPGTIGLLGIGLVGVLLARRGRRATATR